MNVKLVKYLNSRNYFRNKQFGFRQGKSTKDAIINITDMIYNGMNARNKSTVLFIDFRKAFDLVNHEILLV